MGRRQGTKKARRANDLYNAEDQDPVEERQAGRRYDAVEEVGYELPSDFSGEDEEIDENTAFTPEDEERYAGWFSNKGKDRSAALIEASEEEEPDADDFSEEEVEPHPVAEAVDSASSSSADEAAEDGRHEQMLAEITQQRTAGRQKQRRPLMTEAYPESEANLPPVQGQALTVADMVRGLGKGAAKMGGTRRELERLARRAAPLSPPLPGPIQARQRRQAGYEATTQEVSKWGPLVKANREAPTLDLTAARQGPQHTTSVAGLTSSFKAQSRMEREIEALLQAAGAASGGSVEQQEEALALKELSAEEAVARQNALARMRSLLLRHTEKARHLKKIKSKDFHRRSSRAARLQARRAGEEGEEGYMKLAAEEAELNRARERLTLRHKNTSRWARRALKRGINLMDAGTKEALQEQMRLGQELRRKVERVDEPGEDDSSGGSTEASDDEGGELPQHKMSQRAARKLRAGALDILEGDPAGAERGEEPQKGLFALPFMRRAMERQQQTARLDAQAALRELDAQDAGQDGDEESMDDEAVLGRATGRFAFGGTAAAGAQVAHASSPPDSGESSDENEDAEAQAARRAAAEALTTPADIPPAITTIRIAQPDPVAAIPKRHPIDPPRTAAANAVAHARQTKRKQLLPEQTYADGNVSEPGQLEFTAVPAAASEPAATAFSKLPPAPSQRKRQKVATPHNPPDASVQDAKAAKEAEQAKAEAGTTKRRQRANEGRDAAIEQLAVSHSNGDAEEAGDQDVGLQAVKGMDMSQRELIAAAFAGDDVQADFEAAKAAEAEAEAPPVEEPSQLPGWGNWASRQKDPQWLLNAKDRAKRQREEALKARKDANMKGVIMTEKWDKKASKYGTASLPFPYDSRDTYERQMRQPLGPDFNTSASHRDFIRPAVLKHAGVMIQPIKYTKPQGGQQVEPAGKAKKRRNASQASKSKLSQRT